MKAAEQPAAESLLTAFKTLSAAERRRHASVLNYWLSVRGDREFPPLHDLDPLELTDAGPSSILLELISGGHDAEIRHLGEALREEAWPDRIIDAPDPSVLSCIAKKLPIVAISRDFLAFEDEYETGAARTRCSVTLLPLSAGGAWVDYVYALVSVDQVEAGAKSSPTRKPKAPDRESAPEVNSDLEDLAAADERQLQGFEAAEEPQTEPQDAAAAEEPKTELEDLAAEEPQTELEDFAAAKEPQAELEDLAATEEPHTGDEPRPSEGAEEPDRVPGEPVSDIAEVEETEALLPQEHDDEDIVACAEDGLPDAPPEPAPKASPGFSKLLDSLAGLTGFYGSQPVKVEAVVEQSRDYEDEPLAAEESLEAALGDDGADNPHPEAAGEFGSDEPEAREEAAAESASDEASVSPEGSLQNKLSQVRAKTDEARMARLRANSALYEGLGAAYDFALDAEEAPEEYLRLVEAQGLKIQLRSPMKPVVKLAFAGMCDEPTIKQLEAVLAWAFEEELPRGALPERIEAAGGIASILNQEAKAA